MLGYSLHNEAFICKDGDGQFYAKRNIVEMPDDKMKLIIRVSWLNLFLYMSFLVIDMIFMFYIIFLHEWDRFNILLAVMCIGLYVYTMIKLLWTKEYWL